MINEKDNQLAHEAFMEAMNEKRSIFIDGIGHDDYYSVCRKASQDFDFAKFAMVKKGKQPNRDELAVCVEYVAMVAYMAGMKDGLQKQANNLLDMVVRLDDEELEK